MPHKKVTIPENTKELYKKFLIVHDEFTDAISKQEQAQDEMENAENLGLREKVRKVRIKMLFLHSRMFVLNLAMNRVFGLLLQKQRNFIDN